MLINTHENATKFGEVPFFKTNLANLVMEYGNITYITYKDVLIPYYQIEEPMPSSDAIS